MKRRGQAGGWWRFQTQGVAGAADGVFRARGFEGVGRLYFPLCSEAGALGWISPRLQGGIARDFHHFLGHPMTAEELPHNTIHRDLWVTTGGRRPEAFSLAGYSGGPAEIEAGPNWFRLRRRDPRGRFEVTGSFWCPEEEECSEAMLFEIDNISGRELTLRIFVVVPIFGRSADRIRDHRHVSVLLHRARAGRSHVETVPALAFDERGHVRENIAYRVRVISGQHRPPDAVWADQEEFLGEGAGYDLPRCVFAECEEKPARVVSGRGVVAAFRFDRVRLPPGGRAVFGAVGSIRAGERRGAASLRTVAAMERSLENTRRTWLAKARRVVFGTPDARLNNWLTWVNIQPEMRRLYGNSYLPEFDYGRGGKGWRDLWQDCLALLLYDPRRVRAMLLHNFGGVRIDGSNATIIGAHGEFVADRNDISRIWMDHGAWPVHTTLFYVDQTGDLDFLLAERSYFRDQHIFRCRRRDTTWDETRHPRLQTRSGREYRGSVLEHMLVQNLTAFFDVGEHNLCRLQDADWNDALDSASEKGESAAFSAFYAWNLERLAEAVEELGRGGREIRLLEEVLMLLDLDRRNRSRLYEQPEKRRRRLEKYLAAVSAGIGGRRVKVDCASLAADLRAKASALAARIREREWIALGPGEGFFNGYYDNRGRRVEGRCRGKILMMLPSQVFALMSGIATGEQVTAAARAVERHLRDARGGIRLNTDFGRCWEDIRLGRMSAFAYGEKENGAVFSHMAVMYACALYDRRRPRQGRRVWHALYRLATDNRTARIFPGLPEYFNTAGRGMYCYLTGSASWMVFLLLTRVYGIRGRLGDLVIDPQLMPEDYDASGRARVGCDFAGRRLEITFHNPERLAPERHRVAAVRVEGRELSGIPEPDGGIRIARRTIMRLPAQRTNAVDVHLARI